MMEGVHLGQSSHSKLHQSAAVEFEAEGCEAYHALEKKTGSTFHPLFWPINYKFPGSIYMLNQNQLYFTIRFLKNALNLN